MPQKVLIITYSTGGDGEICNPGISDQVASLKKRGVSIDVWTVRISHKASYLKTAVKIFLLNFQKRRYDLVHAFYSLNGLLARLQFISPVIVTLMGSDLLSKEKFYQQGGRDALVGKIIVRFVDKIIVRSAQMAEAIPCKKDHIYIIPSGINTDIFKPAPLETTRREIGLPLDEKCILFPYNPARSEKGFPLIKEAVDLLCLSMPVNLVVVYNQPRNILAKYMNACDVLVLASHYEGSPVAVREALACNLPIVSVKAGDVPRFISKIEGCYLCERNAADIADKVSLVFKNGKRVASRETITSFDVDWSAVEVMKIYQLFTVRS